MRMRVCAYIGARISVYICVGELAGMPRRVCAYVSAIAYMCLG